MYSVTRKKEILPRWFNDFHLSRKHLLCFATIEYFCYILNIAENYYAGSFTIPVQAGYDGGGSGNIDLHINLYETQRNFVKLDLSFCDSSIYFASFFFIYNVYYLVLRVTMTIFVRENKQHVVCDHSKCYTYLPFMIMKIMRLTVWQREYITYIILWILNLSVTNFRRYLRSSFGNWSPFNKIVLDKLQIV